MAQYADNYFLKNATIDDVQKLTGINENVQEILNEARFELGLNNKLQMDLSDVVNDNQDVQKSAEIKEQDVPFVDRIIE